MKIPRGVLAVVLAVLGMALSVGCTMGVRRESGAATSAPSTVGQAGSAQPASGTASPNAAGAAGPQSIEAYAAAIKANSQRTDHESDSRVRVDLAEQSTIAADACLGLDPHAAACQYGKAVATGLEARVHPARAVGLLGSMLENLGNADAADPKYDNAGPSRVRALVLIRAPAWPIGPGDTDAGLAAARRAVSLQPEFPPNVLALAEALSKTGDEQGAREDYAHARDLAQAMPASPDRDDWLREADARLQRK